MILYRIIVTGLAEEASKMSEEIAFLPNDKHKDVHFEGHAAQASIALQYILGEETTAS
jgi:hypothetical protein